MNMIVLASIAVVLLLWFCIYLVVRKPKRRPMIKLEPPIVPPPSVYYDARRWAEFNRDITAEAKLRSYAGQRAYQPSAEAQAAYLRGLAQGPGLDPLTTPSITDGLIAAELIREMGNSAMTPAAPEFGGGDSGGAGASDDWSAPDSSSSCDSSSDSSSSSDSGSCDAGGGDS